MKNKILFTFICILIQVNSNAQSVPLWTQTINSSPDSSTIYPVSTKVDLNGNVYVLCTETGPVSSYFKVRLYKYDTGGNLLWNQIYDNGGVGEPRGFDMVLDSSGYIYVAGGYLTSNQPMILKFAPSGMLVWQQNTITAFSGDWLFQIIYKNGRLHVQSSLGLAVFTTNGNEIWSNAISVNRIAVDNLGRVVAAVYMPYETIVRYNTDGTVNFLDSTVIAKRIAIDQENNITLLTGNNVYEIVHYDSSGTFSWKKDSLPLTPPFGDYSLDILADLNNDIIAIGLNDTMYKFDSNGNQIWKKSMDGLDSYSFSARIVLQNELLIAGTVSGFAGYDIKIATYNLLGEESWYGMYSSNFIQEFEVDLAYDLSSNGMYVLEDSISNSTLMKFELPVFLNVIDYNLICVDSIWYDTINPNYINITVFNGNLSHLNYPSIQMVSFIGDTISNPDNLVNFFAHLGNTYQTYTDTITELGITDFSDYRFFMSEGFGDTTVQIGLCLTNDVTEMNSSQINVYPNPANGIVHIKDLPNGEKFDLQIFDMGGRSCYTSKVDDTNSGIDIEGLLSGLYILKLSGKSGVRYGKVIIR